MWNPFKAIYEAAKSAVVNGTNAGVLAVLPDGGTGTTDLAELQRRLAAAAAQPQTPVPALPPADGTADEPEQPATAVRGGKAKR